MTPEETRRKYGLNERHLFSPPPLKVKKIRRRYPFRDMRVGDFWKLESKDIAEINAAMSGATSYANANGWKFTIKRFDYGVRFRRTK